MEKRIRHGPKESTHHAKKSGANQCVRAAAAARAGGSENSPSAGSNTNSD
jgi:hypothetical protein